jgi:hypothetical protein
MTREGHDPTGSKHAEQPLGPEEPPAEVEPFSGLRLRHELPPMPMACLLMYHLGSARSEVTAEEFAQGMAGRQMYKLPKLVPPPVDSRACCSFTSFCKVLDAKESAQYPNLPSKLPGKGTTFVTIGVITRKFEAKAHILLARSPGSSPRMVGRTTKTATGIRQ